MYKKYEMGTILEVESQLSNQEQAVFIGYLNNHFDRDKPEFILTNVNPLDVIRGKVGRENLVRFQTYNARIRVLQKEKHLDYIPKTFQRKTRLEVKVRRSGLFLLNSPSFIPSKRDSELTFVGYMLYERKMSGFIKLRISNIEPEEGKEKSLKERKSRFQGREKINSIGLGDIISVAVLKSA